MNKKLKQHQSVVPGHGLAVTVVNQDISFALKSWKRKLKDSKILDELKTRKEFIKPSVLRRDEIQKAAFKQRKQSERI